MEVVTLDIINAVINSLKYANPEEFEKLHKRVVLSNKLALKIDENIAYKTTVAALLKDIGSIGAPTNEDDTIFSKYKTYRSTEIIRIMPEIIPFQYDIADVILEINERIDGSGNPAGKSKVLLQAQIIGVVEDYLINQDIEELIEGTKYDPRLVEELKNILEKPKIKQILKTSFLMTMEFKNIVNKYNVYKEFIEGVEEEQFLTTISSMIDAKHKYTGGHTKRVATYSYSIAKQLNYGEEELSEVRYAAYLHDIGKLAIDVDILDKPGKLSDEEFEKIKLHAKYSYEILEDSPALMKIASGALHHERIDGKGYPFGISGDDIPEVAKIIAIADILDALTSNRPYRKPFTFKEAFELMEMMVDTAIDKDIFNAAKKSFNIE